jgi:hypothetical protein
MIITKLANYHMALVHKQGSISEGKIKIITQYILTKKLQIKKQLSDHKITPKANVFKNDTNTSS